LDATSDTIYALAEEHLRGVKRSGPENIMAYCPFHQNTGTPAFTLSLTKGLYICFSCQEKGNFEMFLEKVAGLHADGHPIYGPIAQSLARDTTDTPDPLRPNIGLNKPIPEALLGRFEYVHPVMERWGFDDETLTYFDVGFDNQNKRITFPLRDHAGSLVGISGRAVDDHVFPKYKIYDSEFSRWDIPPRRTIRGEILWNYNRVFDELFPQYHQWVVLVEGFKSTMWLHQARKEGIDIPPAIALLGSYMSAEQQWLLEHLGAGVYVMTDNDKAGERAREIISGKLAKTLPTRVVFYPEHQPTDVHKDDLKPILDNSIDYFVWQIQRSINNGLR
jgi:DNA primase